MFDFHDGLLRKYAPYLFALNEHNPCQLRQLAVHWQTCPMRNQDALIDALTWAIGE